jgi:hypothetical protein
VARGARGGFAPYLFHIVASYGIDGDGRVSDERVCSRYRYGGARFGGTILFLLTFQKESRICNCKIWLFQTHSGRRLQIRGPSDGTTISAPDSLLWKPPFQSYGHLPCWGRVDTTRRVLLCQIAQIFKTYFSRKYVTTSEQAYQNYAPAGTKKCSRDE